MAIYKYVNKSDALLTIGAHDFAAKGELVYDAPQADLDAQDGILVDAYIDGVAALKEFTPQKLDGPIGISREALTTAELALPASTTAVCSLNIAPGVPPTTPVDGDVWTTVAGIFVQVNGVTKTISFTA